MLSQGFIEQVKSSTDMVELAKRYADLKLVGDGIWQAECPHPKHQDDTPSFIVWESTQSWACMGCHYGKKSDKYKNYGSDCFAFLQWVKGLTWKQSIEELAKEAGILMEKDKNSEIYEHKKRLAIAYNKNNSQKVLSYLRDRGLDSKDIEDWGIGFDGIRITFPLYDRYKRVLGFSKRIFMEKEGPKYRNSSNADIFNKSCYLYGWHLIDNECDEIRITEGCLDVVIPNKYSVKNIVATLGTSFTENHVDIIKNSGKTPVFCMDGDSAGLKSVKKAVEMLSDKGVYSKILIIPDSMDMADLANELKDDTEDYIRDNAITYGQFLIKDSMIRYESKINEIKLKMFPEIKEVIKKIPEGDELKIIKDYISSKMGINL